MALNNLTSLSDIETTARELAERLLVAGKQEALLLGIQLEGLKDLAQIMSVRDRRHEWNAHVGMRSKDNALREREIAAMEQTAEKVQAALPPQSAPGPCFVPAPTADRGRRENCELLAGHAGAHRGGGMTWSGEYRPCGHVWKGRDVCALQEGHEGRHETADLAPLSWPQETEAIEPTKPAADRLHELVSHLRDCAAHCEQMRAANEATGADITAVDYHARAETWTEASRMLEALLMEGGI